MHRAHRHPGSSGRLVRACCRRRTGIGRIFVDDDARAGAEPADAGEHLMVAQAGLGVLGAPQRAGSGQGVRREARRDTGIEQHIGFRGSTNETRRFSNSPVFPTPPRYAVTRSDLLRFVDSACKSSLGHILPMHLLFCALCFESVYVSESVINLKAGCSAS